jgi:hypothetical protein
VCVLAFAYFVGPLALLGVALAATGGTVALAAGGVCALVYATQAYFTMKASRVQYLPLAPLSGLLVTAAIVTGFLRFRRGGISWKGVKYSSDRFKPL